MWVGDSLGYLEQVCLISASAVGHPVTLYSYTPDRLKGVPPSIELRDAREVMPEEKLVRYADCGAVALGANFFRYELLAKDLGYWIDADLYFLKPLDFGEDYVFGWEYENWLNNSVMYAPKNSKFVRDLMEIPQKNRRPPWFGPKRTLNYYWRRLTEGDLGVEDMPWGTYSAGMLTHVAKTNGILKNAQPPEVFYPIRWKEARLLYGHADEVENLIRPNTYTVHCWNSRLVGLTDNPPPKGSYIDLICSRHGVETRVAA